MDNEFSSSVSPEASSSPSTPSVVEPVADPITEPIAFAPGSEAEKEPATEAAPLEAKPTVEAPSEESAPAKSAFAPPPCDATACCAPAEPISPPPPKPAEQAEEDLRIKAKESRRSAVVSVGEWMWSLLLSMLPGIGLIPMILFAFFSKKDNKRTLFKALLIWTVIVLVIALICFGVLAALVGLNLLTWKDLLEIFD